MKPILFNSEMVKAILDGRKTQTRRVIKPQPPTTYHDGKPLVKPFIYKGVQLDADYHGWRTDDRQGFGIQHIVKCPYGTVSDVLWVRETIYGKVVEGQNKKPLAHYKADDTRIILHFDDGDRSPVGWDYKNKVVSARFMQKRFARIFLEITNIRVERVQDISEADCVAEGIEHCTDLDKMESDEFRFIVLWESINAKRAPWKDNCWVWIVEFKETEKP